MRRYVSAVRARGLLAPAAGTAALLVVAILLVALRGPQGAATPEPSPSPSPSASALPTISATPPVEPGHTPWPTPDPNIWRFQGTVRDEAGNPIEGVCVHSASGCHTASPRTDRRGLYYFEVAQRTTIPYDLWFAKEGYQTYQTRVTPQGPTVFDVTLRRSVP